MRSSFIQFTSLNFHNNENTQVFRNNEITISSIKISTEID